MAPNIATNTSVELDELPAFVRPRHRAARVRHGRSATRVAPERWGPVATGGFPAHLAPGS
ncbi:hypothetical protein ACIG0A_14340 [Streptomyces californicus]|uniref:hypothetical protein n=1 Tax=Streptomyces TaxID=1883 RepID=UPI001F328336|nr:hypothetical protein [Streptomyces violaceoruber]MCF3171567.1 hypothetical protein [Streptomyces violaceoruber]